ncbi:MAG: hydroxyethylthiazole kinase, partial [Selenomonadaceae bacterium]|nr:hydroxyethylthiazole kinase [Selenomonadaceae bacterium]
MDGSNKDRNVSRLTEAIPLLLGYIRQQAPLIHCITNPISINDCANILLAIGARPIMAEHPKEVAEITAIAKALALNLGNITDARMESMRIASQAAHRLHIPAVIDLVGIACSSLRLDYARKLISQYPPAIIKGNISELRTLLGLPVTPGMGVEAGAREMATAENAPEYIRLFKEKAREYHTTLLATGPMDLVVSEHAACTIQNGTEALASITGTGCMT